ncbi:hypothetical protein [Lentzea sp. HUAS12]|uniref:hypothetical protein n=1 Tax=Lentzea sp. HUAS12 TaxID=2951806 RepID=UPI00209E5283|nr:hypothetical protein [Lentzea sp. HUAS12]USX55560.1 hypothetical protein ND450_16090 [Lentzea sp. HUAS12]
MAAAHVLAMTAPGAAGRRIVVASGQSIALNVGALLKADVNAAAQCVLPGRCPTSW